MEEPKPGQQPNAENRPTEQGIFEKAAPQPQPLSEKEKAQVAQGQERARLDRDEALVSGHGDHKGEEEN